MVKVGYVNNVYIVKQKYIEKPTRETLKEGLSPRPTSIDVN